MARNYSGPAAPDDGKRETRSAAPGDVTGKPKSRGHVIPRVVAGVAVAACGLGLAWALWPREPATSPSGSQAVEASRQADSEAAASDGDTSTEAVTDSGSGGSSGGGSSAATTKGLGVDDATRSEIASEASSRADSAKGGADLGEAAIQQAPPTASADGEQGTYLDRLPAAAPSGTNVNDVEAALSSAAETAGIGDVSAADVHDAAQEDTDGGKVWSWSVDLTGSGGSATGTLAYTELGGWAATVTKR